MTSSSESADPSTLLDTGVEAASGVVRTGHALELGRVFARYVVLQHVGAGGAGSVYAAYDPELDRKVALKVLNDERLRARQRLMREAQAIAKVTHPNIVTVHDVGTHRGRVYIAMEFVDGTTLRRWLVAEPRTWREILAKACEAGQGLAAAHDAGLVHRDFKPDNVLVDRSGRVVVLDFGLARRAATSADSQHSQDDRHIEAMLRAPRQTPLDLEITGAGALMGTPAYMAPEQHLRQRVDARTDQFSFCVVVWEALFGERPFPGESPAETGLAVTRGTVREPRRASAAPTWVRRVLEQGLRPDAADRYPDMRALILALSRDPWRARRRVAGIVGVIAVAATGGYLSTGANGQSARCVGDPARWAGVWDTPRREQIEAAFSGTGLRYAEQAFGVVSTTLDGYVDRWNTLHREACEATHVHQLQSRSALELQWACLGRRRGEVAALTDELLLADGRVVEHAVEAVRGLRRLEGCGDVESLAREPALPADEGVRAQIELLRERLVDAHAKSQAARYEQSLALATQVVDRGQRLGAGAVVAEAKLQLGAALEATGRFSDARRRLMEAVWAGEAVAHDEVVAEAWTRLVWVVGVELQDTDDGQMWAEFADAAVVRAGDPPRMRAQLIHNTGGVLYRQGRLDEALDHYARALEAQQEFLGPEHPQIATTLNHIANTLIELHRYTEALDYAQRSLALRERMLGPQHPKVAASLNNIGELRRKQGKHAESLAAAEQSLAIVGGRGGPEELVALALQGQAQVHLRRWRQAAAAYERLVVLREAAVGQDGGAGLAASLRALADIRTAQGELDAAAALRQRAERWRDSGESSPASSP